MFANEEFGGVFLRSANAVGMHVVAQHSMLTPTKEFLSSCIGGWSTHGGQQAASQCNRACRDPLRLRHDLGGDFFENGAASC